MNPTHSTPKNLYQRSGTAKEGKCCLCNSDTLKSHLIRIYSVQGKQKEMERKVLRACGIDLAENDGFSNCICRKYESFVNKIWEYRQGIQQKFDRKITIINHQCDRYIRSNCSGTHNKDRLQIKIQGLFFTTTPMLEWQTSNLVNFGKKWSNITVF